MPMPMPMPMASGWNIAPAAGEAEEYGIPARPMGLKVLYTFDKEAKVNCLARGSQTLRVHAIPVDETNTIGVIDLRACIHTVTDCSPELTTQECDYTVYAVDYSEPDTPLVGQGLLSWILESMRGEAGHLPPKMVTGRVTKNLLGVFNGNRETLEVRLKLSETTKLPRPIDHGAMDLQPSRPMEMTMTPTGASEWTSFIQSNPHIGQPAGHVHTSRVASPALSQGPSAPTNRRDSLGPAFTQNVPTQEVQRVAPTPVDPHPVPAAPAPSSRPSSRASNRPPRRKPPTGRPRGRPRKKPAEGHTSGYEDGTEGEEGPAKKRAKTTKVEKNDPNPFVAGPESLRVAASNSSSLRNFRPIAVNSDSATSSHLQEVPRAPTPAPDGVLRGLPGRGPKATKLRHESTLRHPLVASYSSSFSEPRRPLSPGQDDGRSPESIAPTPNYSDGSPADIGSSPPIQRATPYIRSSPPPSSPVLPPMPSALLPRESSFVSELDELFGEEQPPPPAPEMELPPPAPVRKAAKQSSGVPIQVFQIQHGPAGQDLVHICSYTTPHPSSSAPPAPPEAPSLPPLKQDYARPQPRAPTAKRKRPRAPSSPVLAPTPPPTTDAVEKAMSPAHVPPTPVPVLTPAYMSTPTPAPVPARTSTPAPVSVPTPAPTSTPGPVSTSTPAPELPQVAAPPLDDASEDPIVQLASYFSMREAPQPVQLPPQLSHPPIPQNTNTMPKHPRQLNRSQSAGPLALPWVPASDPIGSSSLSRFFVGDPECPSSSAIPPPLRRSASIGPLVLPVPESAPAGPAPTEPVSASVDAMSPEETCLAPERPHIAAIPPAFCRSVSVGPLALPIPESDPAEPAPTEPVLVSLNSMGLEETCPPSDSVPPPSSPSASRSNKNIVKKHAIKQRLEEAITNGVMPPYCSNCGAIETPTWRKIWVQEREGIPEHCEYSEKPGKVTTMEILRRDAENQPTLHRVIKKSLAPADDKADWQGMLLCNPCGIWLAKCKCHRPPDRWDKDASRLGQERRKRGTGRSTSRPKKSRNKDGSQVNPTSEAYLPTDALEPPAPSSPRLADALPSQLDLTRAESRDDQELEAHALSKILDSDNHDMRSQPGSTHSRGSGTAQSPIEVVEAGEFDEAVGSTKRLLFPSPRKDGVPKVLCDVDVNLVQTSNCRHPKEMTGEKENTTVEAQDDVTTKYDDLEALIRSLAKDRPSTPPPNTRSGPVEPFKTPTRPTPNHRPITRSVSRSLRSGRSVASPSQQAYQQTPTKTPRSALRIPGSSIIRRSPRNHQGNLDVFGSPMSRGLAQMLSEHNGFGIGDGLDLSSLPVLDRENGGFIDFGNLLSTENAEPSSPPIDHSIGFDYNGSANVWSSWHMEHTMDLDK